jgi:hypothetical protein
MVDLAWIESWLDRRRRGRRGKVDPAERLLLTQETSLILPTQRRALSMDVLLHVTVGPTSELHLFFMRMRKHQCWLRNIFYSLGIEACTWPLSLGYHSDSVLKEERVSASTFHGRIIQNNRTRPNDGKDLNR